MEKEKFMSFLARPGQWEDRRDQSSRDLWRMVWDWARVGIWFMTREVVMFPMSYKT